MTPRSALTDDGSEDLDSALGKWNAMIRRSALSREHKLMCLLVSSYANPDGTDIHCGIATLAVDSRTSYATARRYLKWMRDVRLIELVRQGNRRLRLADEYRLIIDPRFDEFVHVMDDAEYESAKDDVRAQNARGSAVRSYRARHAADLEADKAPTDPHSPDGSNGDLRSAKTSAGVSADNQDKAGHLRSPEMSAEDLGSALSQDERRNSDLRSNQGRSALTLDERPPSLYTSSSLNTVATDEPLFVDPATNAIFNKLKIADETVTFTEADAVRALAIERDKHRSRWLRGKEDPIKLLAEVRAGSADERNVEQARKILAEQAFDEFWAAYPLHKDKSDALKAWKAAVKTTKPDEIIAGARRYAVHVAAERTERKFIKYPAGWLRGQRWTDELITSSRPSQPNGAPGLAFRNYDDPNAYADFEFTPEYAADPPTDSRSHR